MDNKIFITLGSQKFQFNRLLKAVDELCEKGTVDAEDVFAQIGYSDYLPKNFSYKKFLDRDEFSNEMEKANIVITHGGTGAIIGAVKKGKKVIAVPRLAKYGEHVDDHQLQLIAFSAFRMLFIDLLQQFYFDPTFPSTTATVLNRILISNPGFHFLIYSVSSLTTSSKSVILLLPLTCHIPVSPGLNASLER